MRHATIDLHLWIGNAHDVISTYVVGPVFVRATRCSSGRHAHCTKHILIYIKAHTRRLRITRLLVRIFFFGNNCLHFSNKKRFICRSRSSRIAYLWLVIIKWLVPSDSLSDRTRSGHDRIFVKEIIVRWHVNIKHNNSLIVVFEICF